MLTRCVKGDEAGISLAASVLRRGGLVAIPTETVYGLAANALDPAAVAAIFRAKGRPQDNPLIVHVSSADRLPELAEALPDGVAELTRAFWPGPLTLVLPRSRLIPDIVTGGLATVAVRCPAGEIARRIIAGAGVPVAAPSANLSGRPSPTAARHVLDDMDGRIDLVVDGGACEIGLESTVLDVARRCILRPGGVTAEDIERVIGPLSGALASDSEPPRAPGMKYRHYAPSAPLYLLSGDPRGAPDLFSQPGRTGVLCFDGEEELFPGADVVIPYGAREDAHGQARRLFDALRALDRAGVDRIYARCPEDSGAHSAVCNRLSKAASGTIELGG